jgi:predicted RNA methylase
MPELRVAKTNIHYNDEHDIAALIENNILDVYQTSNIRRGDTVLDVGAGIGEFSVTASRLAGLMELWSLSNHLQTILERFFRT